MAVSIAGTPATSTLNAGTTLVATLPASIVSGELLFLSVTTTNDVAVTTPAGWTPIVAVADGFGGTRCATFYKIATGSEGASVSVTVGSCDAVGITARITGQNIAAPINISGSNSNTTGSTTAITSPSVTTTVANCMVIRVGTTVESSAIANPGSNTDIGTNRTGTASNNNSARACYAMQAAIGASGTADFVSTGGNRDWSAVTIAIAPEISPPSATLFLITA